MNPKTETNQEITVAPTFAPNIILTDSASVIKPVFTKLTAITVAEDDEKTREVIIKPAMIPENLFLVITLKSIFSAGPKDFWILSLMIFMP